MKAIVNISVDPDDPGKCDWDCPYDDRSLDGVPWKKPPKYNGVFCNLFKVERIVSKVKFTRKHLGYLKIFRCAACLAATELVERGRRFIESLAGGFLPRTESAIKELENFLAELEDKADGD